MATCSTVRINKYIQMGACEDHARLWANYEANDSLREREQMESTKNIIMNFYGVSKKTAHYATLLWLAGRGTQAACVEYAQEQYS